MELRTLLALFHRRWLVAVIPVAVVALVALLTYSPPPTTYNSGVRFLVGQAPTPATLQEDEERYYNWLASEYIVNGLADWVRGNKFGELVSQELATQGVEVPPYEIGVAADNTRSLFLISINHSDPEKLAAIMEATIAVILAENGQALPQLGGESAVLTQLDTPTVNPIGQGLTSQLQLPLRLAIALVVGIALAFAAEYLDPRIHGRDDVDVVWLGEIPKSRKL